MDNNQDQFLPACWDAKTYKYYKEKYEYLVVVDGKLFCALCQDSKNQSKPDEWTVSGISASNSDRTKAKKQLNKKMDKHFDSDFHKNEIKCKALAKKNILPEIVFRQITNENSTTEKLFKVAYYVVSIIGHILIFQS